MKKIIINVSDLEEKAALIENDGLAELFVQRDDEKQINGNIYKGKVANILPGMESAFLNIGLEKNAFLYVNDLREFEEKYLDGIENSKRPIEDLLNVGDEIIVQILKEPRGNKGARVTTHYTIPGKYLVLMPNNNHIAISQKIKNPEERERLENILKDLKPHDMGVIIRTAGQGKNEAYFEREIEYLVNKWHEIESKISRAKVGEVLFQDNELVQSVVRDVFSNSVDELIIDNEQKYWEIIDYINAFSDSALETKVKLYDIGDDVFEFYGVNEEIENALNETVWLDCGGYLVIQKTEALISIDVNTGKNTGSMNLEETVFSTNVEAAMEIAKQLRLRNLSGIIIIDFIDMKLQEDKDEVLKVLEENLKRDRIKNNIVHFTDLGLVEMTRKRVGKPLSSYFLEECSHCKGTGSIKSKGTIVIEIFREIREMALDEDIKTIKLIAGKKLVKYLNSGYKDYIYEFLKNRGVKFIVELDLNKEFEEYKLTMGI